MPDAHQVVERAQRLLEGNAGVVEVELVEVDEVGLQPAQRGVDRVHDVPPAVAHLPRSAAHRREALGGDDVVVALALQPLPDDLLGASRGGEVAAERIRIGGVEERDALVGRCVEDGEAAGLVDLEAERHRAEADAGDVEAGAAETYVLHESSPSSTESRQPSWLPRIETNDTISPG